MSETKNVYSELMEQTEKELSNQRNTLLKQLREIKNPVSVTVMPVQDFIEKHLILSRQKKSLEEKLEKMSHIEEETRFTKVIFLLGEFIVGIFISYFVVFRTMGENYMNQFFSDIAAYADPIIVMVVTEGIMVVILALLGGAMVKRAFTDTKRKGLRVLLGISLVGFFVSILGPIILA